MAREIRHFVADILEAISIIENAIQEKSFADYQSDIILRLGIERAIEIISEASRRIPEDILETRPEIEWKKVRGIGNILRHEYYGLSAPIIWGVVIDELPRLHVAMTAIREAADHP